MPAKTKKFLFGRLNLLIGNTTKMDLLWEALGSSEIVEHRGSRWGIFDASKMKGGEGEDFLTAVLVKFRPLATEEVVDEARHRLTTEEIEDRVDAKSAFYLHIISGLVAFEDKSPEINGTTFRGRAADVINKALGKFFANAEIQSVDEQLSFHEMLSQFERVTSYSVSLHPSNPATRDIWARIDARIQRIGAQKYKEEFKAAPDGPGLDVLNDEDVQAKTRMAEDGYGVAKATGVTDAIVRNVSTKDNPVCATVDATLTNHEDVLGSLWERFASIFRRLQK